MRSQRRKLKPAAALALLAAPWCVWWLLLDRRDISDAAGNKQRESTAAQLIPNYDRVWYAKNLLWKNCQHRGGKLCRFGIHAEEAWYNWTKLCWIDSDLDNWTNGEELGDPCCIWRPGMKLPWWPATHPSKHSDHPPESMRFDTAKCEAAVTISNSSIADDAFEKFYYAEHLESLGDEHPWYLICFIAIMLVWVRQSIQDAKHLSGLGRVYAACILVGVYLYVDLMSAFLHAFLDNCSTDHALYGKQCRGTQYHHYHPRSQSLIPIYQWFYNPIAVGVTIPVLLLHMIPRMIYYYPPQMNFAIICMGFVWPLTYVFHEFAHLPAAQVPWWARCLQAMGVALHPDIHKAHHRDFNFTWSVLSGIMDFVPNCLARSVYDRHDTSATLGIIIALVCLIWYSQLFFLERWSAGGKPYLSSRRAAEKDFSV